MGVLDSTDFTVMAVLFVLATLAFVGAVLRGTAYPFLVAVGLALTSAAFVWWSIAQT